MVPEIKTPDFLHGKDGLAKAFLGLTRRAPEQTWSLVTGPVWVVSKSSCCLTHVESRSITDCHLYASLMVTKQ